MTSSEGVRSGPGPVPEAVVPADGAVALADDVGPRYAWWGQRVLAALFDNAILAGVTWLVLGVGFTQPTMTPGWGRSADDEGWSSDPLVLVPIGVIVLLLVLQGRTGWTPGKLVLGIRVVSERTAAPAGLWTTACRWVLHLLDAIFFIGYLRPLFDRKRQTFADTIAHTVVVQGYPELRRRPRTVLYAAAVVVVVLGVGYGCVPISSSGGSGSTVDAIRCTQERSAPALTSGDIALGGSTSFDREQRLWTVRETRTMQPGARFSWSSAVAARDVDYAVELEVRPSFDPEGPLTAAHTWELDSESGSSDIGEVSDAGELTYTRTVSPDGDTHVAEVQLGDPDSILDDLGQDLWLDVRLLADGDVVGACGGSVSYPDVAPDEMT